MPSKILIGNLTTRGYMPAVAAYMYTSTDCITIIDKFTVTNVSALPQTFRIWVVPNNSTSVTDPYLLVSNRPVQADETFLCPELVGKELTSGVTIAWSASDDYVLTVSTAARFLF